mgnify:CR=1 FL=1
MVKPTMLSQESVINVSSLLPPGAGTFFSLKINYLQQKSSIFFKNTLFVVYKFLKYHYLCNIFIPTNRSKNVKKGVVIQFESFYPSH